MKEKYGLIKMLRLHCLNRNQNLTKRKQYLKIFFIINHPVIAAIKEYENAIELNDENALSSALIKMDETECLGV